MLLSLSTVVFLAYEPPSIKSMSHCCCRVHFPRLECRTDATHVVRCALGTGVRALNWCLAASAGFSALCLAAGISRSALICRMLEVRRQLSCLRGVMSWVYLGPDASQQDPPRQLGGALLTQQRPPYLPARAHGLPRGVWLSRADGWRALQAWASECVLEMAAPPVAASAYWTLQSAAALVATQLGTTLRYIMQQHSMWHMAQVRARCCAKGCCRPWRHRC